MRRADRAPVSKHKNARYRGEDPKKPGRWNAPKGTFRELPVARPEDLIALQSAIDTVIGAVVRDQKELTRRIDDLEAWRTRNGATVQSAPANGDLLVKLKGLMNRTADEFGMIAEIPKEWQQYGQYTFGTVDGQRTVQQLFEAGIKRGIEAAILYVSSES